MAFAWQPIETAPRDGTSILVVRGRHIEVSRYYRTETFEFGVLKRAAEGWSGYSLIPIPDPTHWAPLPPLPEKEADDAAD
jgi:hypothetical protein